MMRRQLYAPSAESLRSNLSDMGASLEQSCCELSRNCVLDRLDRLPAQFNSAQTTLQHLRRALISERTTGHGTG